MSANDNAQPAIEPFELWGSGPYRRWLDARAALASCSAGARGIWFEIACHIELDRDHPGFPGSSIRHQLADADFLASMTRLPTDVVRAALSELAAGGALGFLDG